MNEINNSSSIFSLNSYRYDLPPHLIAQYPVDPRDRSRLLVMDRTSGDLQDRIFAEVTDFFKTGDTLVLNRTRVIPARLFGNKETGAAIEILLLVKREEGWEALVKPARRMKRGAVVKFPGSDVSAEVAEVLEGNGCRLLRFNNCPDMDGFLTQAGQMPLPPYIDRETEAGDREHYQTVYAREPGSAAAPTAGLHFTWALLEKLQAKGVEIVTVVLHVGLGTFRPVSCDDIREHQMHFESYHVSPETALILNRTRDRGGRIIATGTTVVRTLETIYTAEAGFSSGGGITNKFIYPGYTYGAVDGLITNFHLPGSSLLMLVSAFAGLDHTLEAYRHAVAQQYRFFSYGDAMIII